MASLLNFILRAVFLVAFLVLLAGLLVVGTVVGLVWWLVALVTGGRRPVARVWVDRFQQQAARHMRRGTGGAAAGRGEVVEAEVREVR